MHLSQHVKCFFAFAWIILKNKFDGNRFSHAHDNFEISIIGVR